MPKIPTKVKSVYPMAGRGEDVDALSDGDIPRVQEADEDDDAEEGEIIPDGYESQGEFLSYWLKQYRLDVEADKHNIDEAMEDLRFIYVDQWDEETRAEREEQGRPCITVNTLPQYIGQVVGDRRINKTTIKVLPTTAANKKSAEVLSGLIKSIEHHSAAERVYDTCCEDQVGAGVSNFEVVMEYAKNDVFNQDIWVKQLDNPFAVVWDRASRDVTGRDAMHCFVQEDIDHDAFVDEYGMEPPSDFPSSMEGYDWSEWHSDGMVKIAALWILIERPAKFALMEDGEVEDVTDVAEELYAHRVVVTPDGEVMVREGVRTYAQRWMITGFSILEGPYEIPLSRLPIIKVSGRVGRVGTKQYRFGLVRWARDPSLMRNYWRSVAVETLAMAPRNQWLADAASVKGREDDFRAAHLTGDPLLVYNTGKAMPARQDPPALPHAVLNEAQMNTQDIKDVTGLHDASLGMRSNEVSGKAIMARQREGDVSTITFHDHLNLAILEGGRVIGEMTPICYDTVRTLRVTGIDDMEEFITVNDPFDEDSPNITTGRYDYRLVTGPSYTTQRVEASEMMMEMTKTMPELMSQAADITMESLDLPGSERLAKRFKKLIPVAQQEEQEKEAAEAEASGQPVQPNPQQEQEMAAQQMAAQLAEQEMQMQQQMQQMQMQELQLKLVEQQAKVAQATAQAREAEARAIKAEEDARKARADADRAESEAERADDEVEINRHVRAADLREREQRPDPANDSNKSGRTRARKGNRK